MNEFQSGKPEKSSLYGEKFGPILDFFPLEAIDLNVSQGISTTWK